MSDKMAAAEAIRRLALQYAAMVDAADALEKIGSMEQASKEAELALNSARTQRDEMLAQAKTAKESLNKASVQADAIVSVAKEAAAVIAVTAKDKAKAAVDAAEDKALNIVYAADARAQASLDRAKKEVEQEQENLAALIVQTNKAMEAADAANAAADAAESRLSVIRASISKMAEA